MFTQLRNEHLQRNYTSLAAVDIDDGDILFTVDMEKMSCFLVQDDVLYAFYETDGYSYHSPEGVRALCIGDHQNVCTLWDRELSEICISSMSLCDTVLVALVSHGGILVLSTRTGDLLWEAEIDSVTSVLSHL